MHSGPLRIRFWFESRLIRLALVVIPPLPRAILLRLATFMGMAAYIAAPRLRRIALANLDLALGSALDQSARAALAKASFRNFARMLLDIAWFTRDSKARVDKWVTVDPGVAEHMPAPGVSFFGVTAHFGNWELLSRAFRQAGYEHVAVAAILANPDVDQFFNSLRANSGVEIIPQQGAVRGILKAVKAGKSVALLLDQNTKPADGGVWVELFGMPATMSAAPAVLAGRTGVQVIPLFCEALPDGHYRMYALPPLISHGKDTNPAELCQSIAACFEQEIRRRPDQWLWMYKRWKLIPDGMGRERFPWYAKALPGTSQVSSSPRMEGPSTLSSK